MHFHIKNNKQTKKTTMHIFADKYSFTDVVQTHFTIGPTEVRYVEGCSNAENGENTDFKQKI